MEKNSSGFKKMKIWEDFSIYLIFVVLLIICGILSPNFFTQRNIFNLLRQQSFLLIVSLGMLLTIINGGIDLSVGALLGFTAILTTILLKEGLSVILVIPYVLGVGILGGFSTGLLIDRGRINPFIATLAMMSIYRGFAYIFSHGHPIFLNLQNVNPAFIFVGTGYLSIFPVPVVVSFGIALLVFLMLKTTVFGRMVFAIGGNKEAVRFSGIKTSKYIIAVYAISGFLCSLAGIIFCSRLGMAHPGLGEGYELDAIAAVILGGGSFAGGQGSVLGTIIGVLILGLIRNILNLLNVAAYPQLVIKGIIIIIAVLASELKSGQEV